MQYGISEDIYYEIDFALPVFSLLGQYLEAQNIEYVKTDYKKTAPEERSFLSWLRSWRLRLSICRLRAEPPLPFLLRPWERGDSWDLICIILHSLMGLSILAQRDLQAQAL